MHYDIIIIGSGPAGLAAGLYAARGQMRTLILEKGGFGGQIATSWEVEIIPERRQIPLALLLLRE